MVDPSSLKARCPSNLVVESCVEARRPSNLVVKSCVVPQISSTPPSNLVRFFVAFEESLDFLGDFIGFLLDLLDFGNYSFEHAYVELENKCEKALDSAGESSRTKHENTVWNAKCRNLGT
ncbi:uncharacterized protein A4U43_C05F27430 [Asparagus officinalis]|uniref:Uncharacterized protein n=1 Tax=Asparagus officinalis TaxID=4686 RepID=A0A5P1EZE3_ASPOF|nr:uncharacterized protein A4U43_C05F27430 [Asparagus officinalis]